jgi:hypothetical protein
MHKGDTLGRKIEECFLEWGIGKIFTVPIDNASSKIGMKCIDTSITKIRSVVRYVRSSLERAKQFKRCVEKKKIVDKGYLMLRSAIKFEKALARFAKDNKKYLSHIGDLAWLMHQTRNMRGILFKSWHHFPAQRYDYPA